MRVRAPHRPRRRRGARARGIASNVDAVEARAREAPRDPTVETREIDPRHAQAAIVENKREDLARDAARLERLEKKMEDHEQLRDSEDADVTEEQKADARNYVATHSGQ